VYFFFKFFFFQTISLTFLLADSHDRRNIWEDIRCAFAGSGPRCKVVVPRVKVQHNVLAISSGPVSQIERHRVFCDIIQSDEKYCLGMRVCACNRIRAFTGPNTYVQTDRVHVSNARYTTVQRQATVFAERKLQNT
jgi:hypothetical protein